MSGPVPRRSPAESSETPDCPYRALSVRSSRWQSGTPPCGPRFSRSTHNNETADPIHESAVTSIAAAGVPPEPHERETVIVARPRPLGSCAHRMARYKVIRQREDRTKCARCPGTSETRGAGDARCDRVVKIPDTGRSERPLPRRYCGSVFGLGIAGRDVA